jgi:hypothetical protein
MGERKASMPGFTAAVSLEARRVIGSGRATWSGATHGGQVWPQVYIDSNCFAECMLERSNTEACTNLCIRDLWQ